ncbi:hypothetical protein G3578_03755 [Brevibacillus sp. SYP-B805]|uniref:hypothetical protein n=1 Tax=Brevibacillus sp. SYP-B805 TaxID=1578199 RepID=UPI0013ED8B6D|nr:hypothetical protein [Brevibacillus sp. SYP-B805]NGQ94289.1 hypothetical protein [Brevibacillus sp. SYP-B805]
MARWSFVWRKSSVTILASIGIVVAGTAGIAAAVGDSRMIEAVHHLDIFGLTNELVEVTGDMIEDTHQLSERIGQVGTSLAQLDVQQAELMKQVKANAEIQAQLERQLQLNREARGLMENILSLQGTTAALTGQVGTQAARVTDQIVKTSGYLSQTGSTTVKLRADTDALIGKLTALNQELDRSADSFRFIGRLAQLKQMLPPPVADTVQKLQEALTPSSGVLPLPDINNLLPVPSNGAGNLLPVPSGGSGNLLPIPILPGS